MPCSCSASGNAGFHKLALIVCWRRDYSTYGSALGDCRSAYTGIYFRALLLDCRNFNAMPDFVQYSSIRKGCSSSFHLCLSHEMGLLVCYCNKYWWTAVHRAAVEPTGCQWDLSAPETAQKRTHCLETCRRCSLGRPNSSREQEST